MANQQLINFYRGTGKDAAGRTIAEVLRFDFGQLETVHDYIQWLFPTSAPSKFNPDAPLLDAETIAVFRSEEVFRERLQEALGIMLEFYGLQLAVRDGIVTVRKSGSYAERKGNWQDAPPGYLNHNLLRLTRILECLTLVGMADYAVALYGCLAAIQQEEPEKIPARTAAFWQQALQADSAI